MSDLNACFRAIPSTDKCLEVLASPGETLSSLVSPDVLKAVRNAPRSLVREAVQAFWDARREAVRQGACDDPATLSLEASFAELACWCARQSSSRLQEVINGTGVVIHTNTGRSVLAPSAARAVYQAACSSCTLEFDGETGGRGSRNDLLSYAIRDLAGAEDGIAVNNNAAAVLLALDTLCKGGEVVISRGELVEIGGSFRIPDVMESTGVMLKEVGATNRTHLADYERAINESTRAIIRVHTSNYRIVGFHSAVPTDELAALAHRRGLPLLNDLGSGSFIDFAKANLPPEPTVPECLRQGCDLVLCSGDKLLGGPQAGIIAGRADLLARIRKNPLLRALRMDKLSYAGLEATLRLYYEPERACQEIPTLRRMLMDPRELARQAKALKARLVRGLKSACSVSLAEDSSRAGGGAFPECILPTMLVELRPQACSAAELKRRLLRLRPILIGRLENDAFCLDPRTIEQADHARAAALLRKALDA